MKFAAYMAVLFITFFNISLVPFFIIVYMAVYFVCFCLMSVNYILLLLCLCILTVMYNLFWEFRLSVLFCIVFV